MSATQQEAGRAQTPAQAREQLEQAKDQLREAARNAAQASRDAARASGGGDRVIIGGPGGFTIEPPDRNFRGGMPHEVENIANGFFVMCAVIVIGWPLARAFGKRIERRNDTAPSVNPQLNEQLQRIEQAVDAMSIEVERISESQRFLTKLQSENAQRATLPADRS